MNISIGQGRATVSKRNNSRGPIVAVFTAAAVAVIAGALLWQASDTASTPVRQTTAPSVASAPVSPEFVPTYYYLVNSEEEGFMLLANYAEAESFNHTFFIDMSNPESQGFLNS